MEAQEQMQKARQYLEQARNINTLIDSKLEQIMSLKSLALKVNSVIAQTPASKSYSDAKGNAIIKIIELEQEVDRDIDHLLEVKVNIMKAIGKIQNPKERVVLELRYLSFQDWQEIAGKMHLQLRRVYQIHKQALKHIELPAE